MTFGDRLADLRKKKGLSQEALGKGLAADGTDAGKQVVLGWEKNRHFPKVDQLERLCTKLACSADYLLFGQEKALSPMAHELGTLLDQVMDERSRERAFYICRGTIQLALGEADESAQLIEPKVRLR